MAWMTCNIHGGTVPTWTSKYVVDAFINNKTINPDELKAADLRMAKWPGNRKFNKKIFDKNLLRKYNLLEVDPIDLTNYTDEDMRFFDELEHICPYCFEDYLNKIGFPPEQWKASLR